MENLTCQFCGSPLESNKKSPVIKCEYCSRDNYIKLSSADISAKTTDEYYELLKAAATFNSLSDLEDFSNELLKLDSNDLIGKYFKSYTNFRKFGNDELKVFFMSPVNQLKGNQLFMVDHMTQFLDFNYKDAIENFLKITAPQKLNAFIKAQELRIKTEDNYAKIPRDIFISSSSKDSYLSDIVVKEMEKESFSCWISTRNLRKNSPESYWKDIEDAILLSRVCLVIGSKKAMLSKDVQREIDYAKKHNVRLVELKIDEEPHNIYFKHAFDGNRWVDGFNDFNKGLESLKTRIFQEISHLKNQGDPTSQRVVQLQTHQANDPAIKKNNYFTTKILLSLMLVIFIAQIVLLFFIFTNYYIDYAPNAWQLFF